MAPDDRVTIIERLAGIVRQTSLTNILMVALLVVIAVPAYFSYRFMTDEELRRELLSRAVIVDKHVPCIVLEAHRFGSADRHTIGVVYGIDGRLEKVVGVRAPGTLSDSEIDEACQKVLATAERLKALP
jgi:hypothetical protein